MTWRTDICVIGGGFTGAAAAIACLSAVRHPFRLTIVEPRGVLGGGVAYGAQHPLHLLNVRARDLTVDSGRPGDFANWMFKSLDQRQNDLGLLDGLGHAFLPRQMFGEYVRERLFEAVERRPDVGFTVVNASATACHSSGSEFRVATDGGQTIAAGIVILATAYGRSASHWPDALYPFGQMPHSQLAAAKSMVLIGSGLTMVDALLGARRAGFGGQATIVSRRGQLPREHAAKGVGAKVMPLPRTKSLARLTASVRIACEAAEAYGTPWQAVVNGIRESAKEIWQELNTREQARFLRHVQPFWQSHRHRLPSELFQQLNQELEQGRSRLLKARVTDVTRKDDAFLVELRRRGAKRAETMTFDLAYDCSGHRPDLSAPLIRNLIEQGAARADPHRLGLSVGVTGQVFDKRGVPRAGLYALGPLCQGSLWETTAVPEIVNQAELAAAHIASALRLAKRMSA